MAGRYFTPWQRPWSTGSWFSPCLCGPLPEKMGGTRKRLSGLSTCLENLPGAWFFWRNRLLSATDGGCLPDITLVLETCYPEIIPELEVIQMKPTDFANHLTEFLSVYLPSQKNVSKNTIYSYRDTFKLLLKYCRTSKPYPWSGLPWVFWPVIWSPDFSSGLKPKEAAVFLPEISGWQPSILFSLLAGWGTLWTVSFPKVMSIPIKKASKTTVAHLTPDAIKLLLEQPDKHTLRVGGIWLSWVSCMIQAPEYRN